MLLLSTLPCILLIFWRGCALPFLVSVEHNIRYYNTRDRGRRDGQVDGHQPYKPLMGERVALQVGRTLNPLPRCEFCL